MESTTELLHAFACICLGAIVMVNTALVLGPLSALANTLGQSMGVGGRPFLQILFQAVFKNSLRTSSEVIATALLVNTIAFSLGVPGYNALGLYDSNLVLQLATVSVPAAVLGASAGSYVPDRGLRLVYSALASATSAALLARASRLASLSNTADHSRVRKESTAVTPLLATLPKSPPLSQLASVTSILSESSVPGPTESFSREGNFLFTDEVEHINMLDESDADDEAEGEAHRFALYRPIGADNTSHSCHIEDDSETDEETQNGFTLLRPCRLLQRISSYSFASFSANRRPRRRKQDPLTRMMQASRISLSSLTSSAQSLLSMSASTTVLPRNGTTTGISSTSLYGSTNNDRPVQWQLLDLALARYTRPTLTATSKGILFFGGLLCGALGVGVAETVLLTLVGVHDVPLAAAATSSLSVAFYAQMTASVMDGVASSGDMSTPHIAESVPWGLVAAIVPGVVVGALVGPRIHAFVPERRMLHVAAGTLAAVSISVAIVGHLGA